MLRNQPKVLLTGAMHPEPLALIAEQAQVRLASATDPATLIAEAREADVIVVRHPLPEALFETATRLRGTVRHGAGIDMIPLEAATRHGIIVANAPSTNAVTVAEYAAGQMLTLARRLRDIDATLRRDGWAQARTLSDHSHDLAGRTLGLLGVGAIGSELARICHAGLRMNVIGYRRSAAAMPAGVAAVGLDALFERADVLVVCCPLDADTRGLVDRRRIGLMKPGALLINVARGPIIDEAALIDALREGRLGGAALDVFTEQPLDPASELLQLPNVMLSAHMAGLTPDSMLRMGRVVAMQTLQILAGELPTHFVNPEAREQIRQRLDSLKASR
ncbi:MAG: hydroxyacid dehydrogenase [Burkholderiaceae bacterium]